MDRALVYWFKMFVCLLFVPVLCRSMKVSETIVARCRRYHEEYRRCITFVPVGTTWVDGANTVRTQLLPKLCWAVALPKPQKQPLDEAVIQLGQSDILSAVGKASSPRGNQNGIQTSNEHP